MQNTFAAGGGTGSTGWVTSAAFKEVNVVGFAVGLTTISGPVCACEWGESILILANSLWGINMGALALYNVKI